MDENLMMRRKKKSSLPEARQKILEAANRLFTDKGYAETTTRMIAEEAGVNETTIYHHFKGKMDLFREVYLANTPNQSAILLTELTNGQDLRRDFYFLFMQYMETFIRGIPYYKLSVQEIDTVRGQDFFRTAGEGLESMRTHLLSYLTLLKMSGVIRDIDCEALSEYLFSVFLIKAPEFLKDKGEDELFNTGALEQAVSTYADYFADFLVSKGEEKGMAG